MNRSSLRTCLTVLFFSVVINIAGNYIAIENAYRFLYLDMIGTLVAAVILGPLWGMGVGILTNVITSLRYAPLIYFTSVNAIGGLFWGLVAQFSLLVLLREQGDEAAVQRKLPFIRNVLGVVALMGIAGGAVSSLPASLIEAFLFRYTTSSFSSYLGGFTDFGYVTDLLQSVPDKILTAVIGILFAAFLFRFSAFRLTERFSNSGPDRMQRLKAAFLDQYGQLFLIVVSALYAIRVHYVSTHTKDLPSDTTGIFDLSHPSGIVVALCLYWFVALAIILLVPLIAGRGVNTATFSANADNFDVYMPRTKTFVACIIILGSVLAYAAYLLVFLRVGITPDEYLRNFDGLPLPQRDLWIVGALLAIFASFIIQDRLNSHTFADYREGKRLKEIDALRSAIREDEKQLTNLRTILEKARIRFKVITAEKERFLLERDEQERIRSQEHERFAEEREGLVSALRHENELRIAEATERLRLSQELDNHDRMLASEIEQLKKEQAERDAAIAVERLRTLEEQRNRESAFAAERERIEKEYEEQNLLNELVLADMKEQLDKKATEIEEMYEEYGKLLDQSPASSAVAASSITPEADRAEGLAAQLNQATANYRNALGRIDELEQQKADLEKKMSRQNFSSGVGETIAVPAPSDLNESAIPEFERVVDAVKQAKVQFGEHLIFLDSAIKSAKDSPYRKPQRVFTVLKAVNEVCSEWAKAKKDNRPYMDWHKAFSPHGIDYKEWVSDTVRNMYDQEYSFLYNGQKRLFGQHITEGSKQADKCFSVHMYRDEESNKVVIGHVGRHLTNTKTS